MTLALIAKASVGTKRDKRKGALSLLVYSTTCCFALLFSTDLNIVN